MEQWLTQLVRSAEEQRLIAERPLMDGANKIQRGSEMADIPLTREAIPSLLTRAKLSPQTREMEERRLASIEWERKVLAARALRQKTQKRSRGRYHYKRKAQTKKARNRKTYEKAAGFGAILRSRGAKRIDQTLWDKYVGECFREYSPEYLTVKKIKRPPGFGQSAYYGNKQFPLTVYSYRVHHQTLGVVWDGEVQRKLDGEPVLVIEQ